MNRKTTNRYKPSFQDILKSIKSELHAIAITVPTVEYWNRFTITQLIETIDGNLPNLEPEYKPTRRPWNEIFIDLRNTGVFGFESRRNIITLGSHRKKGIVPVNQKIGGRGFPKNTKEMYWVDKFSKTEYHQQAAWLALGYSLRNDGSLYTILGRNDKPGDESLNLANWANILIGMYEMDLNGDIITRNETGETFGIANATLDKRLKKLEKLGYIKIETVGRSKNYILSKEGKEWLKTSQNAFPVKMREALKGRLEEIEALEKVSVHLFREKLNGSYTMPQVQAHIKIMKRKNFIFDDDTTEYEGSSTSYRKITPLDKLKDVCSECLIPLKKGFDNRRDYLINILGFTEFTQGFNLDRERYWQNVGKSLKKYRTNNPMVKPS